MGGLTTLDAIYLALTFIVPGFVLSAMRNQFINGQERQGGEQLIRFLTCSVINYVFFSVPIYFALEGSTSSGLKAAVWLATILIGPAILGIISGLATQRGWIRWVFHRCGPHPVHVVPTAWDYQFGKSNDCWMLVVLKDGTRFAGYYGLQSFATSDQKERDLYIERVFDLDGDNNWIQTNKSAFVVGGEIRSIEFLPVTKEESNGGKTSDQRAIPEGIPAFPANECTTTHDNQQSGQGTGWLPTDNEPGGAFEPAESGEQRQKK